MARYCSTIEDGSLFIKLPEGTLEVGEMDTIVDILGGETYTVEYTEKEASLSWLDTEDARITFDVHDVLDDYSFGEEFVETLAGAPLSQTDSEGYPVRTSVFTDLVTSIWDSKGTVTDSSDFGAIRE